MYGKRLLAAVAAALVAVAVLMLFVLDGDDESGGEGSRPTAGSKANAIPRQGKQSPRARRRAQVKTCRRAGVELSLRSVSCREAARVYRRRRGHARLPRGWRCAPRACARFEKGGRERSFSWSRG